MFGLAVPDRRQRFAADYVLPSSVVGRLHTQHPELADTGPALRGLRQWLRLRIATDRPLGMPSLGV